MNLNQALSDAELDELANFLESDFVPDGAMDLSMLDGYLTAIAIGPETILPSQWLPRVWGDAEEPTFDSLEHAKKILQLLTRYYNEIVDTLMDAPEECSPFLYEYKEDGESELSAEEWCIGFSLGVHLRAEAWAPLLDDKEASQILTPIVAFSLEEAWKEVSEGHDDAEVRAALIALLPTAVQAIHAYWLPFRQTRAAELLNDHFPLGGDSKIGSLPLREREEVQEVLWRAEKRGLTSESEYGRPLPDLQIPINMGNSPHEDHPGNPGRRLSPREVRGSRARNPAT